MRIMGDDNACEVLNILPDVNNIYDVWSSPSFISLPGDYAIELHIQWVVFYQN